MMREKVQEKETPSTGGPTRKLHRRMKGTEGQRESGRGKKTGKIPKRYC